MYVWFVLSRYMHTITPIFPKWVGRAHETSYSRFGATFSKYRLKDKWNNIVTCQMVQELSEMLSRYLRQAVNLSYASLRYTYSKFMPALLLKGNSTYSTVHYIVAYHLQYTVTHFLSHFLSSKRKWRV